MKSFSYPVILLFFFVFILVVFAGFRNNNKASSPEFIVKNNFLQGLDAFYASVKSLQTYIDITDDSEKTDERAKELFFSARVQYKEIEFLLEYLDPEHAENMNGADLMKGDPNILSVNEIQPKGLQVIETLIFSGEIAKDKFEISKLCQQLMADTKLFKEQAQRTEMNTTMIIEACRKEIIRICFLGVTGFDSPTAKNSLNEAITTLQSLRSVIALYSHPGIEVKTEPDQTIAASIEYIKANNNFDTFNRMYFTKEFGNKIYSLLLDLHLQTGAQLPAEMTPFNLPVNYTARNLFDENLLNPYFYSPQKIDKPTAERIELGKILFFDPILSVNNQRACASCHQPAKAFSDGLTKSTALDFSRTLNRNAPTLINAIFQGGYFYDIRAKFAETQIDHVVFNANEFNTNYEAIIEKLKLSPAYIQLFQSAYADLPGDAIDGYSITKSIADYVRSLVAMDSEFDKYMRNESNSILESVQNGYNLFMGKAQCGTCHFAPVFYGTVPPNYIESETEVLGVPSTNDTMHAILDEDPGRYAIQNVPVYKHAFKTQSVRNVELTAPYMHNGVFTTLEEVLDFYNRGGAAGLGIEITNQTLPADKLNLTKTEINDIIAFMKSLTDTSGITSIPGTLPLFPTQVEWNNRKIGGEY